MVTGFLFQVACHIFVAHLCSAPPEAFPWHLLRRGSEAMETAPRRPPLDQPWTLPIGAGPCNHPEFSFLDQGSVSQGTVAGGCVARSKKLSPKGDNHIVLQNLVERNVLYGVDELLALIQDSAAAVATRFPGAVLGVANLGKQGGGRIPWSVSHQGGRDADLAYYLLDREGRQRHLPELRVLARPGGTVVADDGTELHFDPARNWALVKSLLQSKKPRVQMVFCARFLIKLLEKEAAKDGREALKLLRERVRQPAGTLPHDDHFHIRIWCSEEDAAEGCVDLDHGKVQRGGRDLYRQHLRRVLGLLAKLEHKRKGAPGDANQQLLSALRFLATTGDGGLARRVRPYLRHRDPALRLAALEALGRLGEAPSWSEVARMLKKEEDLAVLNHLLGLVEASGDKHPELVLQLLADERRFSRPGGALVPPLSLQRWGAQRAMVYADSRSALKVAKALVPMLEDPDPATVAAAARSLSVIFNLPLPEFPMGRAAWNKWMSKQGARRNQKPELGFPEFERLKRRALALVMLPLVTSPEDRISFNAQRLLRRACPRVSGPPAPGFWELPWRQRQWAKALRHCR